MTVEEILAEVDMKYPNDVDLAHKWGWLTQLEKLIVDECHRTHQITPNEAERAAAVEAMDVVERDYTPIVQPPYHDVYVYYCGMMIASLNVDTDEYTNQATLYNNALLAYKNKFNRDHRAKDCGNRWRV